MVRAVHWVGHTSLPRMAHLGSQSRIDFCHPGVGWCKILQHLEKHCFSYYSSPAIQPQKWSCPIFICWGGYGLHLIICGNLNIFREALLGGLRGSSDLWKASTGGWEQQPAEPSLIHLHQGNSEATSGGTQFCLHCSRQRASGVTGRQ